MLPLEGETRLKEFLLIVTLPHCPYISFVAVKTNGTINITPPASEVGNDDVAVLDNAINNNRRSGSARKRDSKEFQSDGSQPQTHKKSRRSLIDDYFSKDVGSSQVVEKPPAEGEDEDVYEVEAIVDISKSQVGEVVVEAATLMVIARCRMIIGFEGIHKFKSIFINSSTVACTVQSMQIVNLHQTVSDQSVHSISQ